MLHRSYSSALALALLMAQSGLSHAEGQNPAAAEALFDQGRAALAEHDFDTACGRFRESDRLDPAVGTRFNLADCEEKRGRLATAWSLFRGVVAQLPEGDDRLPVAQRRLAALEPRVPRLTMVLGLSAPRLTRVKEGDTEYAEGSFGVALPLDPGTHRLTVTATGHYSRSLNVALEPGETAEVSIAPGSLLPPEQHALAAIENTSGDHLGQQSAVHSDHRTLGYVLAGVGATGLIVGMVSGVLVLHQKSINDDNCDAMRKSCNQAGLDAKAAGRTLSVVSIAGFASGLAASATGTYFILTSSPARETSWSAALAPETAFFSLRQTF